MRQVLVIATWRSEHLVEVKDEDSLENLVQVLQAQSNVELVGYTAQPLHEGGRGDRRASRPVVQRRGRSSSVSRAIVSRPGRIAASLTDLDM
jgi:hypothetical protein